MTHLGRRAIVVGAGMGGLAAAAALSPSFDAVLILDKDDLPDGEDPRMGAAQGHHAHQLLKAGELNLEKLLPGFRDALIGAGAAEVRVGLDFTVYDHGGLFPKTDPGFSIQCLTRPAYEGVLRRLVLDLGNVEIRQQTVVERLAVSGGRCTGVELAGGDALTADLVADCSGMNAPLLCDLAERGEADFDTENLKVNVSYTSGLFDQPEAYRGERKIFYFTPPPPSAQFALMAPVGHDQWIVSVGLRGKETVPRDLDGFLAFTDGLPLPDIRQRLEGAVLRSGEMKLHRKLFSTRRLLGDARRWPENLIALGDTVSSFNPTFGQGMSVAAMSAAALRDILAARETLDGLPAQFHPAVQQIGTFPWMMAMSADLAYPETEAERPADFAQSRAMGMLMRQFAEVDEEFRNVRLRMGHLIDDGAATRQGPMAERIKAFVAGQMSAGA